MRRPGTTGPLRHVPHAIVLGACLSLLSWLLPASAPAQELTIGYLKNPVQEANVAIMERWAAANGVTLTRIPMTHTVFQETMAAALPTGGRPFDIVWTNDDWAWRWIDWVEPLDDVDGMETVAPKPLEPFLNRDGRPTVVPMTHTVGVFFYRTDLVSDEDVPTTFVRMVTVGKDLQAAGKVKWGYVGAMAMNHTWFTQWWSMWNNQCDIFRPIYERDNAVLAQEGWASAVADLCHQELMEFWWDAMNIHRITPPGMTAFTRSDADAVFMAGDAAFTVADLSSLGLFRDPHKSQVAGKVAMAPFPIGPRRATPVAWNEIWGWAIPKGVPEDRKALAKRMLGAMLRDIDGQIEQWKMAGGPPPNRQAWDRLAAEDPVFRQLRAAVFDVETPMHAAYYFANWPAVHRAYSQMSIKALTGPREAIARTLIEGAAAIHAAAVQ